MARDSWDEDPTTPKTPRDFKEYKPKKWPGMHSTPKDSPMPFIDDTNWRVKIQRINANSLTDDKKQLFLMNLQKWGKKSLAAEAAGCTMNTIKKHLTVDPEFNEAFEHALAFHSENRARILEKQAMEGSVEPVFGSDGQVGERIRYETQLRVLIMRGNDKELYITKQEIDVKHTVTAGALVIPATLNSADWEAQFDEMRAAAELPEGAARVPNSQPVMEAEFDTVKPKRIPDP